jgi:DHA1 family inner membrane transport protein
MAYLRNRTVNLLNLHFGIQSLAMNAGGVFFAVFLLRAAVPVPLIFVSLALIVILRFVQRPFVLGLGKRFGLRPLLVAGILGVAVQYVLLAEVRGVGFPLLALVVVASIGDTLYWTCYHAYFAVLGDTEHRGHQLGARGALMSAAAIAGPIAGGWALVAFGPRIAFGAVAGVQALSAIPLLGTPNVPVVDEAAGTFRAAIAGALVFVADGWMTAGYLFAWQIAHFISLGESFATFGVAMAVAALAGAAGGLVAVGSTG